MPPRVELTDWRRVLFHPTSDEELNELLDKTLSAYTQVLALPFPLISAIAYALFVTTNELQIFGLELDRTVAGYIGLIALGGINVFAARQATMLHALLRQCSDKQSAKYTLIRHSGALKPFRRDTQYRYRQIDLYLRRFDCLKVNSAHCHGRPTIRLRVFGQHFRSKRNRCFQVLYAWFTIFRDVRKACTELLQCVIGRHLDRGHHVFAIVADNRNRGECIRPIFLFWSDIARSARDPAHVVWCLWCFQRRLPSTGIEENNGSDK